MLYVKYLVSNDPFAVLLVDDMIHCDKIPYLDTMIGLAGESHHSVVTVVAVPMEKTSQYGAIASQAMSEHLYKLNVAVEKRPQREAPSNFFIVGLYVPPLYIFELREQTQHSADGEIQLANAIAAPLKEQEVIAYEFDGIRYDCSIQLGHMKVNIEYRQRHPELSATLRNYLEELLAH